LKNIDFQPDLSYQEYPIRILDEAERSTRNRVIKIQWSNHTEEEAMWEREDQLRREFPSFFQGNQISRTRFFLRGVESCHSPKIK